MQDIAITAMAGVFPGADNIEMYWRNILNARVAPLRTLGNSGKRNLQQAFCLPDEAAVVAENMDRQVVIGRKIVGECLANLQGIIDHVGLVAGTEWGSQSYFERDIKYVFGTSSDIFFKCPLKEQVREIAHSLSMRGPCLAVDAACASSLYALDAGICLLRSGQADAVIVLGLNAYLPPFVFHGFSKLAALSKKDTILPFSSQASGIVLGEAVGAVVVEPLDKALAGGRAILGVIRSLGLSAGGAERSVFAPGAQGQSLAYQRAYTELVPGEVDYIEAHGTATIVGDHTELTVLEEVFGPYFKENKKLPIGSVKSLIGHTLAASGMASVIKALLMLRERIIPPHIPVDQNPVLAKSCMFLPEKAIPWPTLTRPGRIGVSAFGFGGANAHLVIESFNAKEDQAARLKSRAPSRQSINRTSFSPLAIVDFEAAFGQTLNVVLWDDKIKEGKNFLQPFPWERFEAVGKTIPGAKEQISGSFFPDDFVIDVSGLRMGPTLLRRVDPFQLLVTHLVRRLVDRNPAVKNSPETAVAFCNNMGGQMPLQLSRKYYRMFEKYGESLQLQAEFAAEVTLEEIASCLPNMCSGYPARHFDLKAFHQTLSGESGIFWTSLLNSGVWLGRRCKHLLLGAGRLVKSPCDLFSLKREINQALPHGEGFGVFLVKLLEEAESNGDKVLAVIRDIIPAAKAKTFEEACHVAGIEASTIDVRERSQLQPEWLLKEKEANQCVQAATGFMAEATGIEALSRVLLSKGQLAAIEVWRGDDLVMTVFLEKRGEFENNYASPKIPLELFFQKHRSSEIELPPKSVERPATPSTLLEILMAWQQSSADMVHSYLTTQRRTVSLFQDKQQKEKKQGTPDLEHGLLSLERKPSNVVLKSVRYDGVRRIYTGELRVDEGHSYFFDHPLDHVPGILLLEGILQLVEISAPDHFIQLENQEHYVKALEISFKRFCEKEIPVTVELRLRERTHDGLLRYQAFILQDGKIACESKLEVAGTYIEKIPAKAFDPEELVLPSKAILHKQHGDNVLVNSLEKETEGRYTCNLLDPPIGHIFQEGNRSIHSALYILEASRQAVIQIAHTVQGVPLGLPMILLSLKISLQRPAQRGVPITLSWQEQPVYRAGTMTWSNMKLVLRDQQGILGESLIMAQAMDDEAYERQRWSKSAVQG